jgi:hypothetical protein
LANFAMSAWRERITGSLYLAAIVSSMVGWAWILLEGVEWVLGA